MVSHPTSEFYLKKKHPKVTEIISPAVSLPGPKLANSISGSPKQEGWKDTLTICRDVSGLSFLYSGASDEGDIELINLPLTGPVLARCREPLPCRTVCTLGTRRHLALLYRLCLFLFFFAHAHSRARARKAR